MKLSEKLAQYDDSTPYCTFEFFPPRTDEGFDNLLPRIARLASFNPLAISVTWGAGGSTKDRSVELASLTQARGGSETILHLTCTNMIEGMVDDVLQTAKQKGIQNILALRGDPPRGEEEWTPIDPKFTSALDLIRYIKSSPAYADHFCVGAAAYPDGHPDRNSSPEAELELLKKKVEAGVDFIITQLFYDVDRFLSWVKKVRAAGINIPIIPGIMPIQTYSSFQRVTALCGTIVSDEINNALRPIRHDDQKVKDFGINLAVEMIQKIMSGSDIRGVHFCTLNLERSIQLVLERLRWTGNHLSGKNKVLPSQEAPITTAFPAALDGVQTLESSSVNGLAVAFTAEIETTDGPGDPKDAASWDDFPNGRFGDYKSPAFGDQGLWGGPGIAKAEALAQWGEPLIEDDLTLIFLKHVWGQIPTTPFSPSPLSPESKLILTHLEAMTLRGWWTVGSQPAVDGADSADERVGWGPSGGYVFQKAFVEFFANADDVNKLEKKVRESGNGWVDYICGDIHGAIKTNLGPEARNAVTWGVFPGQEIAQSTIIERHSFLSWKEEAFAIWGEWSSFYRPGSYQRNLLENVCKNRWLVSVVHHNYLQSDALWTFLLDL